MRKFFHRKLGGQKGFTLIELMVVVAIIGILAAIAIPLYANVQARARTAKAQADLRAIASAITMYQAHMGAMPAALTALTTVATNPNNGQQAGPFLANVPTQPTGWSAYTGGYTNPTPETFQLTTTGDNTTVTVP